MIAEQVENKWGHEVHQSRWGHHPCSYDVFMKLKLLNKLYSEAIRNKAQWERWNRKDPHNRVTRKKIRNSAGEVVGYQAPEPMSEPELCPTLEKLKKKVDFDKNGKYYKEGIELEFVEFRNNKLQLIPDIYREARYPKESPDDVKPMKLSLKEIDELC